MENQKKGKISGKIEKIEKRVFPKKDGSGEVTVYSFKINGVNLTTFDTAYFDHFKEGENVEVEYVEKSRGRFTNRYIAVSYTHLTLPTN